MPYIKKLVVENFRNYASAALNPLPHTNILYGENGAGKTSLLEAVAVVAHGKSFRSHKYRQLIRAGQESFTLYCEVVERGVTSRLGLSKNSKGETRIRIDGVAASSAAQLAQRLPLLVLTSASFRLLEGAAKERRQFFDWLVFHVEHEFIELWKGYSRCLKQRNTLLRRGNISYSAVKPWDLEMVKLARRIDELRAGVFADFTQQLTLITQPYSFGAGLTIDYYPGWPKGERDYEQVLLSCFERDCQLGYTQHGCHRSDIKIRLGRHSAVDILSRGQQKLLITALYLSAAKFFIHKTHRLPLFVIDDFAAELDDINIQLLSEQVLALGSQVFLTAMDEGIARKYWVSPDVKPAMFHVEHGSLLDH